MVDFHVVVKGKADVCKDVDVAEANQCYFYQSQTAVDKDNQGCCKNHKGVSAYQNAHADVKTKGTASCVSHEYFAGEGVVPEVAHEDACQHKSQGSPGSSVYQMRHQKIFCDVCVAEDKVENHAHSEEGDQNQGAAEAVYSVRTVGCVYGSPEKNDADDNIKDKRNGYAISHKGQPEINLSVRRGMHFGIGKEK